MVCFVLTYSVGGRRTLLAMASIQWNGQAGVCVVERIGSA